MLTGLHFEDLLGEPAKRLFRNGNWLEIGLPNYLENALFEIPADWDGSDENALIAVRAWRAWMKALIETGTRRVTATAIDPAPPDPRYCDPTGVSFPFSLEGFGRARRGIYFAGLIHTGLAFDNGLRWALYSHHEGFSIFAAEPDIISVYSAEVGDLAAVRRAFDANIDFPVSTGYRCSADLLKAVVRWPPAAFESKVGSKQSP